MPVEAYLALLNYAGNLSQRSLVGHQVTGHIVTGTLGFHEYQRCSEVVSARLSECYCVFSRHTPLVLCLLKRHSTKGVQKSFQLACQTEMTSARKTQTFIFLHKYRYCHTLSSSDFLARRAQALIGHLFAASSRVILPSEVGKRVCHFHSLTTHKELLSGRILNVTEHLDRDLDPRNSQSQRLCLHTQWLDFLQLNFACGQEYYCIVNVSDLGCSEAHSAAPVF